jgi:hypothetical protein
MAQISLFQDQRGAQVREDERTRRGSAGWPLEKVVFVGVIGLAFACAVFGLVLPIWVWLD